MSEKWEAVVEAIPLMEWMEPENIIMFLGFLEEDMDTYDEVITLAHKCEKDYDYNAMDEMDALEHFQNFHTAVFALVTRQRGDEE